MSMDVDFCKRWLNQIFSERNDCVHLMQEVAKFLGQKSQLVTLLRSILDCQELLNKSASQSYIHYNGFDKIVILSSTDPQYKLRLHIWWPSLEESTNVEHIHNHRWNFSTHILSGSYISQEFQAANDGDLLYEYKYSSSEGKDCYSMDFVGCKNLKCTSDSTLTAGNCYTLTHSVLHRVVSNRNNLTSTLMLQGPVVKFYTSVFSYQQVTKSQEMNALPLSVPTLIGKIEKYLAFLETGATLFTNG